MNNKKNMSLMPLNKEYMIHIKISSVNQNINLDFLKLNRTKMDMIKD